MYSYNDYEVSAKYINSKINSSADTAIILGSGLGGFADRLSERIDIPFAEIPGFPRSTVQGHKGELSYGLLGEKNVLLQNGRFHFYEGYALETSVFPIRVYKLLGIKTLIVTNAAGGINKDFVCGDLMIITDHIKFFDDSPLRGSNMIEFGGRFPDMSQSYSKRLINMAEKIDGNLKKGVYAYMPGPSFETPAEIRALRTLGADAVGMSTVPEVITARHTGIEVMGISCITNMAAGILDQPLTHEEVMETGKKTALRFGNLLNNIAGGI